MSALVGLLKKEFRLGLTGLYFALFLLIISFGFGFFLMWKLNDPAALFGVSLAVLIGHIFYLPSYLSASLYGEKGKMNLWLHNPHSGITLLLAKFINGLLAMMISLFITSVVAFYNAVFVLDILGETGLTWNGVFITGLLVVFHIVAASLYITIWGVFLWTINLLLGQFIGKLRWIIMSVLVIFGFALLTKWEISPLFMTLTHWGVLPIEFLFPMPINGMMLSLQEGGMTVEASSMGELYIGMYVYYAIVATLVFFVSGWLLGRKVEV